MAPEIVLKQCYDPLADLWSIGIILFECLFGYAPYKSKSIDELLVKIKTKQKIEIPKSKPISSKCEDCLRKLLKHEPSERMTFEAFFSHKFIDILNIPTEEPVNGTINCVNLS